ncbi:hypothetical protein [Nocardia mangyaensis]|uniref:hypothetical protein n=1 Tax=Nocardia mangyaensis TaxID=2213200 RepID=UPI002674B156|nr:hypothetical protein [Nocardia mangyaensis]MDO3649283.1 hypothetical protein [Nocardia mangyaensis]
MVETSIPARWARHRGASSTAAAPPTSAVGLGLGVSRICPAYGSRLRGAAQSGVAIPFTRWLLFAVVGAR